MSQQGKKYYGGFPGGVAIKISFQGGIVQIPWSLEAI